MGSTPASSPSSRELADMAARLDAELASLRDDIRTLGAEVDRRRAIDRAVVAERSETTLLN
jgi:hypothetical protein